MYKIGDYIVKPAKGICKVEDILHLDMPAVDERYFALAEDTLYSELEVALEKDHAEIYHMICERCEKD